MTTDALLDKASVKSANTSRTKTNKFTPNIIAVLGAGVMGAQIAAHFANCGHNVLLFDLDRPGTKARSTSTAALKVLKKLKPSPLYTKGSLEKLIPCSYDTDLEKLRQADLIIEAVAENLEIKKSLYQNVSPYIHQNAVFASNTSGLSVESLAQTLPENLRTRFLGVHFFNPPRYMTLVETIMHQTTDQELAASVEHYLTFSLGKNIVRAPDTPNFIANRLGVFSLLSIMKRATEMNLAPDLVDQLTGTLLFRPKSATYFTVDVVGLDVTRHVVQTMQEHLKDDPWHDLFSLPSWIEKLIANKALGMKTKKGCYSKVKGKKVVFDHLLGDYRPLDVNLDPEIAQAMKISDPAQRLTSLMSQQSDQAKFIQTCLIDMAAYATYHAQQLGQSSADIDLALRWGFGWQYGIFEMMQMIGTQGVLNKAKESYPQLNLSLPFTNAYEENATFDFSTKSYRSYRDQASYGELAKAPTFMNNNTQKLVKDFGAARLDQLTDDVWNLSLTTKNLVISDVALEALLDAMTYAEQNTGAVVLGPNGDNFAFGADLKMVHSAIQAEDHDALYKAVKLFQEASKRFTYSPIPVVAATQGMALGGGCEFVMQAQHRVIARESYIGLVEVGVGLIPAAGGCVTLLKRSLESADREEYLFEVYKRMMTAQVSSSAYEALEFGYITSSDIIIPHASALLTTATNLAQLLVKTQSYPQAASWVPAPAEHAWALMESWRVNAYTGGFLHEHENEIAIQLAELLGGRTWSQGASEQELFDKEFDIFMGLLKTEMTAKKIEHMLTTGKPLRG